MFNIKTKFNRFKNIFNQKFNKLLINIHLKKNKVNKIKVNSLIWYFSILIIWIFFILINLSINTQDYEYNSALEIPNNSGPIKSWWWRVVDTNNNKNIILIP
jgi:hypothetical protein